MTKDEMIEEWSDWFADATENLPRVVTPDTLCVVLVSLADLFGIEYDRLVGPLNNLLNSPTNNDTIH